MYEVRIYDGKGNYKKTISEKKVAKAMWLRQGIDPGDYKKDVKPIDYPTAICRQCKKEFKKIIANQEFCRGEGAAMHECYKAYKREKDRVVQIQHFCKKCGKEFTGHKRRRYCNDPCYI